MKRTGGSWIQIVMYSMKYALLDSLNLMPHAGTERAEHIQIIITSTQKLDNMIPT